MTKALIFISVLLIILNSNSFAQDMSEGFCKKIGVSIVQPLKPIKIFREITFENSCDFEFRVDNQEQISIDVEKFKSKDDGVKELKKYLALFLAYNNIEGEPKFSRVQLNAGKYWDETYFYISSYSDNFILLRKNKFNIIINSSNPKFLIELEKMFRKMNFEN